MNDVQIPSSKKNKKERYQEELEERLVSLIASLFGKKTIEFKLWSFSVLGVYMT